MKQLSILWVDQSTPPCATWAQDKMMHAAKFGRLRIMVRELEQRRQAGVLAIRGEPFRTAAATVVVDAFDSLVARGDAESARLDKAVDDSGVYTFAGIATAEVARVEKIEFFSGD